MGGTLGEAVEAWRGDEASDSANRLGLNDQSREKETIVSADEQERSE
jgi:hypothetical protein